MALAQGDDRVTVGVVGNVFRFEIGEHWPNDIFLTVAGGDLFTQIQGDQVNHLTAADLEIGDHVDAGLGFKDETITPPTANQRVISAAAGHDIGATAAIQRVIAGAARQGIGATPAQQNIIAASTMKLTPPITAAIVATVQGVIAMAAP